MKSYSIMLILLLLLPYSLLVSAQSNKITISITNNQLLSTPSPFQQLIVISVKDIGKNKFNEIISNPLDVLFYEKGVGNLYAWLMCFTSTYMVWWVKIPGGIPPESSITVCIYITAYNEYPYTGISPAVANELHLQGHDNGQYVFLYYNNGSSINELNLVNGGNLTLTEMVTPYGYEGEVLTLYGSGNTSISYETVAWVNHPLVGNNFVIDGWVNIGNNYNALFAVRGNSPYSLENYIMGIGWRTYEASIAYENYSSSTLLAGSSERQIGWFFVQDIVIGSSLTTCVYNSPPWANGVLLSLASTRSNYVHGNYIGIATWSGINEPAYFYIWFVRYFPPGGKMPYVSVVSVPFSNISREVPYVIVIILLVSEAFLLVYRFKTTS